MKTNWTRVGLTLVLLTAVVSIGRADYATGFETSDDPGYIAGNTISGVDGWVKTNGSDNDNRIMSDLVNSGTQAMRLGRAGGGAGAWASDYRIFDAPVGQHVIAEVYMASYADVPGSYVYFGYDSYSSNNAAAQFGFDGNEFYYRDGSSGETIPNVTFQANTYYRFVAEIDLTNKTYDLTITGPGVDVTVTDAGFRNAGADEIIWVSILNAGDASAPNDHLLWVDDLSVTPEPATLCLLALGGLGLLRRRSV